MKDKNFKNDIKNVEEEVCKKIAPHILTQLKYAGKVYNILCRTNLLLSDKRLRDIPCTHLVHQILIARIADYLRPIIILSRLGYVDQAATLAASIFELSHTLLYIGCDENRATIWEESNVIEDEMPKIFKKNWATIVQSNKETYDETIMNPNEYNVYKQLCWMKHSLPCLQGITCCEKSKTAEIHLAPYCDDMAIRIATFVLQHSGRYGQLAVKSLFLNHTVDNIEIEKMQHEAGKLRQELNKKSCLKYGSKSPFKDVK